MKGMTEEEVKEYSDKMVHHLSELLHLAEKHKIRSHTVIFSGVGLIVTSKKEDVITFVKALQIQVNHILDRDYGDAIEKFKKDTGTV